MSGDRGDGMEGTEGGDGGGQRTEELRGGQGGGAWEGKQSLQHLAVCNVLVRDTAACTSGDISISAHCQILRSPVTLSDSTLVL